MQTAQHLLIAQDLDDLVRVVVRLLQEIFCNENRKPNIQKSKLIEYKH